MSRQLFGFAGGVLLLIAGAAQAANYDNIYWVGTPGVELGWTGDINATPEYSVGFWSTSPSGPGLPAKFVLGRNDGIRVEQTIGAGGYDADRLPCDNAGACTTTPAVTIAGGTQLGTDIYINNGGIVRYNPNNHLTSGDDGQDRFGDFRFHNNQGAPKIGTPTLNISNGSKYLHNTGSGGDPDGMWSRWNGAELNIDGVGSVFKRTASNGRAGGSIGLASFHGYDNSVQTISLTNGGGIENQGQVWFGNSDTALLGGNANNIRVIMNINGGYMDLTGGDEYGLDNDGLPLRADLSFIYNHKPDADANPNDDEKYVVNFTGPGSITVDGVNAAPLDTTAFPLPPGTGRGGIRVARQTGNMIDIDPGEPVELSAEYLGGETQASYLDLWNLGILRSNNKSGLTGHTFGDYFTTTNNPGDTNYTLTSTILASPTVIRGDFNRDGRVDAADLVVYKKTVGQDGFGDTASTAALLLADADGSLHVDANDLRIWRENFGLGTGPGGSAPIPEPGTMLLLAICLGSVSLVRKRAS